MAAAPYYQDDWVTLYHGDCCEILEWTAADVLLTDPPYGMAHRSGMDGEFGDCAVAGDDSLVARDTALNLWGSKPALVFGRWSVARPPRRAWYSPGTRATRSAWAH